jgi:nitrate/TMAO reductase-like tetraheme cytochrome c subunit
MDLVAENRSCVQCHQDVAAEWGNSLHAHSYRDPLFRSALSIEPTPFCRKCHVPESDPERYPEAALADMGVACITCHGTLDDVRGTRKHAADGNRHAVSADPRLATSDACAGCHEFDFFLRPGALMQSTLTEHARSDAKNVPCQDCHMRVGAGGRRHHGFHVLGNDEMLSTAVRVVARRDPLGARFEIEAGDVGHAVPTGDIFRRLELRVEAVDDAGRRLDAAPPEVLQKEFDVELTEVGPDRRLSRDTRVPPPGLGSRELLVLFHRDVSQDRLRWELAYMRMPPWMYASFGMDAAADEVILARGEIPAPPPGPSKE